MKFKMSIHFVCDRMNDRRNTPAMSITKHQSIFNRLTTIHMSKLLRLKHSDTSNSDVPDQISIFYA